MDLLYSTFKWEGWIMMRRESFPALIKQPGCIKVSLHMARGWNGIVFNVSSNSNHPMVPWSSPVHSSCNTERISRGFDAHQKGIFHHQVWSDFSHCRRFLTLCEFHVCRALKMQQIWLRLYTVLRRYNPNLQYGIVTLVVSTLQREQASLQAFLQEPFPKPGKTLSHSWYQPLTGICSTASAQRVSRQTCRQDFIRIS